MILWLDQLIFGNGKGMKSPYFDDVYYWLGGELYLQQGWLGAQLTSFQWTHPNAGERRELCGREFKPFHSERRWGRVRVAWCMTDLPDDLDDARASVSKFISDLSKL